VAITLAEAFATSDVPPGVINLISGVRGELVPWIAAHMDVNALDTSGLTAEEAAPVQEIAAENVKRLVHFDASTVGWEDTQRSQGPYSIFDFQESKTVWHPIGM
jgi:hypothetical protein